MLIVDESNQFEADMKQLERRFPSLRSDVEYLKNLLRQDTRLGGKGVWELAGELPRSTVFEVDVPISEAPPAAAFNRVTLVYEMERVSRSDPSPQVCTLILVYSNDDNRYTQQRAMLDEVTRRIPEEAN